jgi:hypothetical protein
MLRTGQGASPAPEILVAVRPRGAFYAERGGYVAKTTGRVLATISPRCFFRFWSQCVRSAFVGSIARANALAPIVGAFVLWVMLRAMGWELILPEKLPGVVLVGLACLGSAWLVIFLSWAIFFEPFARSVADKTTIAAQGSKIADLHSKITIPIADLVIDSRRIPEIFTRPEDDAIVHIVIRDFHLTNRSNLAASIEVRLKFNVGMGMYPNQDDYPLDLVEAIRHRDPSIGRHLGKRISLAARDGVTGYLSYRVFDQFTRSLAAARSMNTAELLNDLEKTLEIQDHISGITKSISFKTLGPHSFRELEG